MLEYSYVITVCALNSHNSIAISADEYEQICRNKLISNFGLDVEEKLDLLLENYAELERELLDMSVQHSIFFGSIDDLLYDGRHRVNRRLINLLSSIRLYQDQLMYAISEVYGKENDLLRLLRQKLSTEYDSSPEYRIIEALRNHVQHASLPITSISFSGKRVDRQLEDSLLQFSVKAYIGVEDIEKNVKFKKEALGAIKNLADKDGKVDLMSLIRTYLESVGRIHCFLRESTHEHIEHANNLINYYRDQYKKEFGRVPEGFCALKYDSDGLWHEHEYIFDRNIKRREALIKKNRQLGHFSTRTVTSNAG